MEPSAKINAGQIFPVNEKTPPFQESRLANATGHLVIRSSRLDYLLRRLKSGFPVPRHERFIIPLPLRSRRSTGWTDPLKAAPVNWSFQGVQKCAPRAFSTNANNKQAVLLPGKHVSLAELREIENR
jgi:hypothetical protein